MRLAALSALLLLPLVAVAQVYTWKDASGKMHYADQPPADRSLDSRRLKPSLGTSDDVATASKAATDKRQDAAKQASESKDKAAKAEQEREADAIRQENCSRARQNLSGIESGQIRFRMTASGEREGLDGDAREAELSSARRAVESNCSPRPTTPKSR
jgi:hypothetical protein